jgi:hypothetical protein
MARRPASYARKAGRTLPELRDASSVIEILNQLQRNTGVNLCQSVAVPIRRRLVARKKRSEERENISAVFRDIATTLTKAGKRVKSWPIAVAGFPALEPAIEETFAKGRWHPSRTRSALIPRISTIGASA